jgi:hypothetical protein
MRSIHRQLMCALVLLLFALPMAAQTPQLRLNGANSAEGIDFNSNGKFDDIILNIGLDVDVAGFYIYSVTLVDRNGTELGLYENLVVLNRGSNNLRTFLDATPIGANGVDGPYFVTNLMITDFFGAGISLDAPSVFATQAFHASEFEGFTGTVVTDTTPPTVVVSVTPNVLWPVNHRMVEIVVDVTATDDTDPNPVVTYMGTVCNQAEGKSSPDILFQDGKLFVRAERTGKGNEDRVYTITYAATDAAGNIGVGTATVTVTHDQGH